MRTYILLENGRVVERELSFDKDFKAIQNLVMGDVEIVSVLFKDQPATLCVNENGIQNNLLPNPRATAIYWTATIKEATSVPSARVVGNPFDPLTAPLIYGVAVLFPVDKRRLS